MESKEVKQMRESVQCWADSLAVHLAGSARRLSKADAEALKQLFDWPQMLRKSLAMQMLEEKLEERTK